MKVSSILSIVLLIVAVSMTTVSARDWKFGDGGLARWDFNCDFNGHDIKCMRSRGEQCGGICIANRACTHFTYNDGTCCIKKNNRGFVEMHSSGAVCGFIPGRSAQNL